MPQSVLYAFALLGLFAVVASAVIGVLMFLDHRGSRRAAHRKARTSKRAHELTPVA